MKENRRLRELAKRRKRRRKILLGFLFFSLLVLGGCISGFLLYQNSLVYKICRVEAGGMVVPADFLKKMDENAVFTSNSDEINTLIPGEYNVEIKTGVFTAKSKLIVEDTIAPTLEVCDVKMAYGETCDIKDFITVLQDVTSVSYSYLQAPDFSQSGKQTVSILATDLAGNVTTKSAELWLTPVIPTVYVELGSPLPEASALVIEGVNAEYVSADADCNKVGTYTVVISADSVAYDVYSGS